MNIHHKFVALFNATPGVYANTPSLNDTNALIGFIETVTGIDVTEDSDFIDHVLTNMGFVQDEDSDLWDTAHGAMTGLVSANGRASAVDTAIQFLSTLGTDPTSDYFIPANRLMSKVSGSTAATEANSTEGNAAVLTDVFSEGFTDLNIRQGTLANGNGISTEFILTDTPVDFAYAYLQDGVDGVDATTMLPNESTLTVNGGRIQNSLVWNNLDMTSTNVLRFGHGRTDVTSKALVDIQSSTIEVTGDGNVFRVGIELGDTLQLPPAFTVRLTDSVLTVSDDMTVAEQRSNHAQLELISSTVSVGDDVRIGVRYESNFSSESPVSGAVTIDSSSVSVGDEIRIGVSGGNGELSVTASDLTAQAISVGQNNSTSNDLEASYTSSLVSTGALNVTGGSTVTLGRDLSVGGTKFSSGTATITDSSIISKGLLVAAGSSSQMEASSFENDRVGSLQVTDSTINLLNGTADLGNFIVGQTNDSVGTVTISGSTITGMRNLEVGSDRSSEDRMGGTGSVTFNDSTVIQRSSETPDEWQRFNAVIGREGGVGDVTLNDSTITTVVDSVLTTNDSDGYYYSGWHVARQGSDLTTSDEYDGTLTLNNSSVNLLNEGLGNADLYFGVGARSEGQGLLQLFDGSSLVVNTNNENAVESGLYASSRTDSYGNWMVDNSSIQVLGSAQLNSVLIGNRGPGDATIQNGGSLIIRTDNDGTNTGALRIGDTGGAGTLIVDGVGSIVGGDAYTVMTIGERPEDQYQASGYESNANADTYAGTTGSVTLTNGALLQFGTAGDGIADIFVGDGGSLIASDDSTVVGDIQIIGTGTVSDNLLAYVI